MSSFQETSNTNFILNFDKDLNVKKMTKSIEIVYGLRNFIGNANKFCSEKVFITLKSDDENTEIVIEDDGKGFEITNVQHQDGHLGLYGIQERAELLAGALEIESEPGRGTSLFIEIPLHTESAELQENR